jgi:hypothetical protein
VLTDNEYACLFKIISEMKEIISFINMREEEYEDFKSKVMKELDDFTIRSGIDNLLSKSFNLIAELFRINTLKNMNFY